jgi:hypothetical protein
LGDRANCGVATDEGVGVKAPPSGGRIEKVSDGDVSDATA